MAYIPGSAWRNHTVGASTLGPGTVSGTYIFYAAGHVTSGVAGSAFGAFYLDKSDHKVNKVRITGRTITNAVAPNSTFFFALAPVATWGGASGARASVATTGSPTVVVTIATPAAGGPTRAVSTTVDAPAAGWYVLYVNTSATIAANANVEVSCELQISRP